MVTTWSRLGVDPSLRVPARLPHLSVVARTLCSVLSLGMEVAFVVDVPATDRVATFEALYADVEPRLRRALVAAYGPDAGREATAEALAWAWEHLERLLPMANPAGYLWRVGSTRARRARGRGRAGPWPGAAGDRAGEPTTPEPAVAAALARLTDRQRSAVLLVHGYGYSLPEAAALLGCRVRTLRTHLDRGMAAVRAAVGVDHV